MSQPAAAVPPPSTPALRVARAVLEAIGQLPPEAAAAVDRVIRSIGTAPAQPIALDVPDAPSGAQFFAIAPPDDATAPVVVYRHLQPGEGEGWRVTTLMARDAYEQVREAERRGLLNDRDAREAVARATGVAIANMGTISATAELRGSGTLSAGHDTWPGDRGD
jgi:hypothetical protein